MAESKDYTKKLFLQLQSDGKISLAEDYLWDGCDTPEIDPEIKLAPVSIQKLAQLLSDLYLDHPEKEDVERLKKALAEINASRNIIENALKTIEAKFP